MNRTSAGVRTLQYIALVGFILFLGFPLVWLVSASIKSSQELAALDMSLLPRQLHWDNYAVALQKQGILRSAFNSLVVALLSMVLVVVLSIPASYALARFKGRLRAVGVGWILVSQVFPVILIIIPLFVILRNAHLVDTLVGLVLVYTTFTMPFALWMLQGFVAAIPNELEEAAAMDGAGRFQTLRRIVFPLLMPGIVATAMFAFVAAWNEFFFALVLIQSPENYTLPVALKMFVGGEGKVALGPLAAGAVLATIPSLIVFSILQRRLTGGLLTGSVKG
jgi:multiple sugar transport system permease protein